MNGEIEKKLKELKAQYDAGLIDRDVYETAVSQLSQPSQQPKQAKGSDTIVGDIINSVGVAIGDGARATVNILQGLDSYKQQRDRKAMIEMVEKFWIQGVLDKSLFQSTSIEINRILTPTAVDNQPWADVYAVSDEDEREGEPMLLLESIDELFYGLNDLNRTLLILGEPGLGKTTTLLLLAREALRRAQEDVTHPIPIMFNLSSWNLRLSSLVEWLEEELTHKYMVPRKVSRPWLRDDDLLLLLDGLDEVETQYQAACVEVINQFQQEHRMPIVVCARTGEYALLDKKLQFETAVTLQPLTPHQIDSYIMLTGGDPFQSLRQLLERDASLLEMAQSPLLLNTLMQTFQVVPLSHLEASDSREARLTLLFDAYISRMFQHGSLGHLFPKAETLKWLGWLSKKLDDHSQAIFLIERMQPSWLDSRLERWLYVFLSRMAVSIPSGIVGGVIIGFGFMIFFETTFAEGMARGLSEGVLSCFAGGLAVVAIDGVGMERNGRLPFSTQLPSTVKLLLRTLFIGVVVYFAVWAAIGFGFGSISWMGLPKEFWLVESQSIGLLLALSYSLLFGFNSGRLRRVLVEDVTPVEFISWSRSGMVIGSLYGLLGGVISGAYLWANPGGVPLSVMFRGSAPFLIAIPFLILTGAIFGGLTGRIVQVTTIPNQGVRYSAYNATMFGVVVGVLFSIMAGAIGWILLGETSSKVLATYGLFLGLLAAVIYGGNDVMKHLTLRSILSRNGRVPLRYSRFLDYAVERIFLRKVGGGYIFIHRLLADYFINYGK